LEEETETKNAMLLLHERKHVPPLSIRLPPYPSKSSSPFPLLAGGLLPAVVDPEEAGPVPQMPAVAFSFAIVCRLGVFAVGVVDFLMPTLAWFQMLPNASPEAFFGCAAVLDERDDEPVVLAETGTEVK
jgi:hypothetical protein